MTFRIPASVFWLGLAAALTFAPAQANDPDADMEDAEDRAENWNEDGGERQMLRVKYDFRVAGFNVGKANLFARVENGKYRTTSSMRTAGLADTFFKSRYRVRATGLYDNGTVIPQRYDSDFTGRSSQKFVTLIFDKTGMPGPVAADPPYGARQLKYTVTEEQQREAIDPMSAWLHMITLASATQDNPCGVTVPIFDGRRRYNLNLEYAGKKQLSLERGKLFDGEVIYCKMRFEKIAGYKSLEENGDGKEDDDDALPVPPLTIWAAKLTGDDGFLVPLRMRAETPIGGVIMVAQEITSYPRRIR